MNETLKKWIAQTSSWETFIDFQIPDEVMASYEFTKRYGDLYISLLGELFDHLRNDEHLGVDDQLRTIASGFMFYRFKQKQAQFPGVNVDSALLVCGLIYYLAGYPATSSQICRQVEPSRLKSASAEFALNFIIKRRRRTYKLETKLDDYINGSLEKIDDLINEYENLTESYLRTDAEEFVFSKLTLLCLKRFKAFSVWHLKTLYPDRDLDQLIKDLIFRADPIYELFQSQWDAIGKGLLENNNTVSLQMPTSAGKTAICEIVIYDFLKRNPGKKAVFLAPFRALASEMRNGFCKRLAKLGVNAKVIYGGGTATGLEEAALDQATLVVSTPEKFTAIDVAKPDYRNDIGLLICDEGHLLDDENRGLSYELLVSSFRRSADREMKIVYISAIVPNIADIHTWLDGAVNQLVISNYRPSKLDYAVLKRAPKNELILEVNPTENFPDRYLVNSFIRKEELVYFNEETQRKRTFNVTKNFKVTSVCAALKACRVGPVALFTTQKSNVHSLLEVANEFVERLPEFGTRQFCHGEKLEKLHEYFVFSTGNSSFLSKSVRNGFIYHHGDLPQELRERAEAAIRENTVRLIICTNTLAEGVNLPVSTLVIHTIKRYDPSTQRQVVIKKRDIKNIVGRSGRAGKSLKGLVILSNPSELPEFSQVIQERSIEPVKGRFSTIVKSLSATIGQLEVTNQLLDSLSDKDRRLIDEIDVSISSLINPLESTKASILSSIEKTLGYATLSTAEQEIAQKVSGMRWDHIEPYVANGEIAHLKESRMSPRDYESLKAITIANIGNAPLLSETSNSDEVLNFYFDILSQVADFERKLAAFNERQDVVIGITALKRIAKGWMQGDTYLQLSTDANCTVEVVFAVIAQLFSYDVQSIVRVVNSVVSEILLTPDTILGFGMEKFGECLTCGLSSEVQLNIMEAGIGDRLISQRLAQWFGALQIRINDRIYLRTFLWENRQAIRDFLRQGLPSLSIEEFENALGLIDEYPDLT